MHLHRNISLTLTQSPIQSDGEPRPDRFTCRHFHVMVTSSNGNIFRVTGHLCWEFTAPRWIPHTKASDAELWYFFICVWINAWINNREAGGLRRYRAHYDVTVMWAQFLPSSVKCLSTIPFIKRTKIWSEINFIPKKTRACKWLMNWICPGKKNFLDQLCDIYTSTAYRNTAISTSAKLIDCSNFISTSAKPSSYCLQLLA